MRATPTGMEPSQALMGMWDNPGSDREQRLQNCGAKP
jgi:hypothetical protein